MAKRTLLFLQVKEKQSNIFSNLHIYKYHFHMSKTVSLKFVKLLYQKHNFSIECNILYYIEQEGRSYISVSKEC